jgi:hypothetical protein
MKILVIGSWEKCRAVSCKEEATKIGKLLAEKGHILISGGGTGVSEIVVNSYKENKGKKYTAYLPSKKEMEKVGEQLGPEPDEIIHTELDYPERNIIMVKNCDCVLACPGGLGTFTELIHATADYKRKVALIDKGDIVSWVKAIPYLKEKVFITSDINKALEYLEK